MTTPLHVLIVEDRPADAELMIHELRRAGFDPDWRRAQSEPEYLAQLEQTPDLILADHTLPQFDSLRALQLLHERRLDIPLIVVTGSISEEAAVECIKQGAADYLLKDRLTRLGPAVAAALEQRQLRAEKQRADRQVQAREQRFRALIEHSTDAIALINQDGTIIYKSPAAVQILGYPLEELLGVNAFSLLHPDDIPRAANLFDQITEKLGASLTAQFRYRHKDGRWLWIEATGTNLLAEPSVQAFVVNYRDISDRVQYQRDLEALVSVAAALRASTTRADMLPVILNQLIVLLKVDGAALVTRAAVNDEMVVALARGSWSDWTGLHLKPDEGWSGYILGQALNRPYLNNDVLADPRLAQSALPNDLRAVACVPLIAEQHTIGVLSVGRKTDITHNELRLLVAVGDIAANALHRAHILETLEQRVAERTTELEGERARMQAILDSAGEGIVITDLAWTIEYINPAQEQLTGYSAAEVTGRAVQVFASDQTAPNVEEDMRRTLARGETWEGEVINRRKEGARYDVALTLTPLKDAQGNLTGYVGISRDISRLKELDRLKSKFVSDVSHELRTPVTNLKLYIELLEHGKPEKREHYINILREQADRQAHLVEDILNLSRLELGADKAQFRPVDLNDLTKQIVEVHRSPAEAAGLTLAFAPDPDLPAVWGERSQLAQVITNLIANAIQYTPTGQISVSTRLHEAQVYLEVRDTGLGIDPEDTPHVFDRFYRGQRAVKSDIRGTGLGLAIAAEIMRLHNGRIEVESELDVGSVFRIWLPITSQ
ncbi:MAG TPA: PAS domain S-box protein [Anaerolineae bacterium]|nr:PAS domain S-box protein [Anaerolineae bacterium]